MAPGYIKDFELCLQKPWPPGSCSGAPGPVTLRRQFRDSKIPQGVRSVSFCVLQPTFLLRCTAVEGRGDHLWLCREKGCRMQGRDRGLAATVSGRVVPIWLRSQTRGPGNKMVLYGAPADMGLICLLMIPFLPDSERCPEPSSKPSL